MDEVNFLTTVLTVVIAFGLITMSLLSLLNAMSVRLYETENMLKLDRDIIVYSLRSKEAQDARDKYSHRPKTVGWIYAVAVVLAIILLIVGIACPKWKESLGLFATVMAFLYTGVVVYFACEDVSNFHAVLRTAAPPNASQPRS